MEKGNEIKLKDEVGMAVQKQWYVVDRQYILYPYSFCRNSIRMKAVGINVYLVSSILQLLFPLATIYLVALAISGREVRKLTQLT